MSIKQLVLFVSVITISVSSYGDVAANNDAGFFVGGMGGNSSTTTVLKNTSTQKGSASFYGIYGGYNFTDWLGLETAFFNTGDVSDNREHLVKADYLALSIAPKLTYRVSPFFSVYAKAGFAYLNYKETYDDTILFERGTKQTWSGIARYVGIGGQFDIKYGVKVRVGFDRVTGSIGSNDNTYYRDIPDVDAKLDQLSLGMHYAF